MSISTTVNLCERLGVKAAHQVAPVWLVVLMVAAVGFTATALTTNTPAGTNAPPQLETAPHQADPSAPPFESPSPRLESAGQRLDESAFGIIAERNIFNANRSGGQVRLPTSRPRSIETFTLVGTMAYEKGAYAFFEGSSSELTKAVKAEGIIAGHKLADIFAGSVSLEADGKQFELRIGCGMRREDAGVWQVVEASSGGSGGGNGSSSYASGRTSDSGRRSGRSGRSDPAPEQAAVDKQERKDLKKESKLESKAEAEILKRLMERRAKE